MSGELARLFETLEQQFQLPGGYLARTAQLESAMNPNARNPRSSAGGLFQFIDGTAKQYGLADRFDPIQASQAAARFAADNQAHLAKRLGRAPTAAELYLAHQQGAAGAAGKLTNPDARVGGAEITLNAGSEGMTAGAFAQQWIDKFNQGSGGRMTGQPLGEMLAGNTGMQQNTAAAAAGGAQPTAAGAAAPAGNRRGMGSVLGDLMASMQPPAQQLTQPQLQQPTQPAQMRGPDLASILGDPRGPLYLRA